MSQLFILIDEKRRQNAIAFINSLNIKAIFSVEIKLYKKKRSLAQNRTYWNWIKTIAEVCGYEKEELHETFKIRMLGYQAKLIFGEPVQLVRSTSKLTTQEFAEYLTKIELLAAEMSIKLPIPDDYHYALMLDKAA